MVHVKGKRVLKMGIRAPVEMVVDSDEEDIRVDARCTYGDEQLSDRPYQDRAS